MAAYSRRKGHRLMAQINVVPYIDVMLVLLVIFMRDRERSQPERRVSLDDLVKALRAKQKEKPNQPVVIAASKDLPYGEVVEIMDLLQRNQITKVGLLAKPSP